MPAIQDATSDSHQHMKDRTKYWSHLEHMTRGLIVFNAGLGESATDSALSALSQTGPNKGQLVKHPPHTPYRRDAWIAMVFQIDPYAVAMVHHRLGITHPHRRDLFDEIIEWAAHTVITLGLQMANPRLQSFDFSTRISRQAQDRTRLAYGRAIAITEAKLALIHNCSEEQN